MTIDPKDLRGEAARVFQTWRSIGLSESSAIEQLRRDGLLGQPDAFDRLVENFKALGLSPDAARTAAVGRAGSELDARRQARAAANTPVRSGAVRGIEAAQRQWEQARFQELIEQARLLRVALDELSDADRAALVEALDLGRKPAGNTAPPATSGQRPGGVRRTVQESR
jgi:hypothetical protein